MGTDSISKKIKEKARQDYEKLLAAELKAFTQGHTTHSKVQLSQHIRIDDELFKQIEISRANNRNISLMMEIPISYCLTQIQLVYTDEDLGRLQERAITAFMEKVDTLATEVDELKWAVENIPNG